MKLYFSIYAVLVFLAIIVAITLRLQLGYVALFVDFTACFTFFIVLSPIVFLFSLRGTKKENNSAFLSFFMGGFAIKFFLTIVFFVSYLAYTHHKSWTLIVYLFVSYFLFTALETLCLSNEARKQNKK